MSRVSDEAALQKAVAGVEKATLLADGAAVSHFASIAAEKANAERLEREESERKKELKRQEDAAILAEKKKMLRIEVLM